MVYYAILNVKLCHLNDNFYEETSVLSNKMQVHVGLGRCQFLASPPEITVFGFTVISVLRKEK